MTTITLKLRLYPNGNQANLLEATMEQYRLASNLVSNYYFEHSFKPKQSDLQKSLYHLIRNRFGLKAQMTQSSFKTVLARYKTVNTQLGRKPYKYLDSKSGKWVSVKRNLDWLQKPIQFRRPQCDLVSVRDWSLVKDQLSINTVGTREKMSFSTKGFDKYLKQGKLGTAKLVKSQGRYFLHVSCTLDNSKFEKDTLKHVVGLDRGLRFLTTVYDEKGNTSFVSGKSITAKRRKFKRLRQQLQSKGTKSAKRRLKAINQRENRWMSDINHQVTKTLVDTYGSGTVFTIEDLTNVRFATEKATKDKRYEQVSWAFYQFEQFLTYKAELTGSTVIKIDAHYTSQRCPKCGSIDKLARNHCTHEYHCTHCGYTSNDDRVGAMNIQLLGTNWVTDKLTSFKQVKSNEE
ncbi:RNA-guided endonuclease InsQ/TnpB family protein [Secundilactobacillus muriivasis]